MKLIRIKKASKEQIKFRFPVVTNVQEVEELLQGYDLAYKFEDAEGPYPSLIVTGNKQEIIRFAKEVMTGDWESDEDAKEFVDKFIPGLNKLVNSKDIKANEDLEQLVEDALYLFENDESHLDYEFLSYMGVKNVGEVEDKDFEQIIRSNPEKAAKFIRKYIN